MIAVFKLPDVTLYTEDETKNEEIIFSVIQSLEDRYAIFEKVFDLDYDDVLNEIDDYSEAHETVVDIEFDVPTAVLLQIAKDSDLIFTMAIEMLRYSKIKLKCNRLADKVTYLSFGL